MVLVPIPPGEFTMGSPASEAGRKDDETQHPVRITKPFYLSVHEVTQKQYQQVMHSDPSQSKGPTKPVENVSWNDAVEFCKRLSKSEGVEYRLPTDAEWEYACRAGTTTAYSFGDDVSQLPQYAWYEGNSGRKTHTVGEKLPNAWGLYDMHGNVWEWCRDAFKFYRENPVRPDDGLRSDDGDARFRVYRGGGFVNVPRMGRSSARHYGEPGAQENDVGVRPMRRVTVE